MESNSSVLLKDVHPMLRGFSTTVIVIEKDPEPHITRDGESIYKLVVADKTGSIIMSVWGSKGQCIKSGDILRISGVDAKVRKGQLQLATAKNSKLKRIGQDTLVFLEKPNFSEESLKNNLRPDPRLQQQQQQQQRPLLPSNIDAPQQQQQQIEQPMRPAVNPNHPSVQRSMRGRGWPTGRGQTSSGLRGRGGGRRYLDQPDRGGTRQKRNMADAAVDEQQASFKSSRPRLDMDH